MIEVMFCLILTALTMSSERIFDRLKNLEETIFNKDEENQENTIF